VTLAGIAWVVSERRPAGPPHPIGDAEADALASSAPALGLSPPEKSYEPPAPGVRSTYLTGLLLAFVGAAGQAVGLVMSRRGMELADGAKFDPFAATQIRAIAGVIGFALVVTFAKRWRDIGKALRDTKAVGCMALGATFGPFLGVSLLLAASQRIPTGLAQTIVATVPVLMIPVSLARGTERVTWRAALGAIVTVAGVAILMLTRLDEAARNAR
jgi:drug/metabolite transporter (DMT)-like permease